jgi:hypothetical protein
MTSAPANAANYRQSFGFALEPFLRYNTRMISTLPRLEVLLGRSLAMCAHPYAVWRSRSAKGRAVVVVAYMAASYFVVLGALMTF